VFVLCAPEVPCGKFGAKALDEAGVTATPTSLEENVKGVVSKVTLGEADAGIVYVTDVQAAGDNAEGVHIDIAGDPDLEAVYPMGILQQSTNKDLAQTWIDFVASTEGRAALARRGFSAP
jgi:molybdate transport system substrate-binding protein